MKSILKKSVLALVLVVFGLTFTSCQKDSDKQEGSKKPKLIFLIIRMIPKMEFQEIKATIMEATIMEAITMEAITMEATIIKHKLLPFL